MLEKIMRDIALESFFVGGNNLKRVVKLEDVEAIIRKHLNDEMKQERYFTDDEYRILLSALRREGEVCRKVDQDCGDDHKLIRIMTSIKRKIRRIQYEKTWEPYKPYRPEKGENDENI